MSQQSKNYELDLKRRYHSGELYETHREAVRRKQCEPWRILRYQRVLDPTKSHYPVLRDGLVTPETFKKHLQWLSKHCRVISIETLLAEIDSGSAIPENTVALTFDGGWVDHLVQVLPEVHARALPASCFLPTGFVGTKDFFWHDKVLFIMESMRLADCKIEPFPQFPEEVIEAIKLASPDYTITLAVIAMFILGLRSMDLNMRLQALMALGQAGDSIGIRYPKDEVFLKWDEVRTMERAGMRFGSLSHGYNFFADLSEEKAVRDLKISEQVLKDELSSPSSVFAYPEGVITKDSLAGVKSFGLRYVLGGDFCAEFKEQTEFPKILRRITINEDNSNKPELLFATLWGTVLS